MAQDQEEFRFGVIGCGSIGAYVGLALHASGQRVTFLVRRPDQISALAQTGLTAVLGSGDSGSRSHMNGQDVATAFTTDAAELARCSCVLVATKRTSNADVAKQLAQHCPQTPCVLLQNGLGSAEVFKPLLGPETEVIEAVVTFNTVFDDASGVVTLQQELDTASIILHGQSRSACALSERLGRGGFFTAWADDALLELQAGKLLMNLTNAVNALSGKALAPMFLEHTEYRHTLGDSVREAQAVFAAAGIRPRAPDARENVKLRYLPLIMGLPSWLFRLVAGRNLRGREEGRTSMAQDLLAGRVPTEVDFLNGAVVQLARAHGVPTPVNDALISLVKKAEEEVASKPAGQCLYQGMSGPALREAIAARREGGS